MANDLLQMNDSVMGSWKPKEQKYIGWAVSGVATLFAATGAAWLIKIFAPSLIDALGLVHQLFDNGIHAMLSMAGFAIVALALWETFVPGGSINKIFAQYYNSLISKLTWASLNIDPMTPLYEKQSSILSERAEFEEHFSNFDGAISKLEQSEEGYRSEALDAERKAKAAEKQGNKDAFDTLSYAWGSYNTAADRFALMRNKLIPTRDDIAKILKGCDSILDKLKIDIRITSDMWGVQKDMAAINKSARRIMRSGDRYQLAQQAADLVQTKYAAEFGRLNNLKTIAKPLLDSIDLEKGAYSEELLARWNAAPKLLVSDAASQNTVTGINSGDASVSALIR